MEVIVVILCLIILVGTVVIFNYAENVQKKIKDLEESINIAQEQKEMYKREISRFEYDKKVKDCKIDDMIIGKKITHHIKGKDKFKVIVGDYNLSSIRNTCGVLLKMGFDVEAVQKADDIIEQVKNGNDYDLIITNNEYDRHSNYKQSTDVLDSLKEIKDFEIPIIVLTVSNDRNHFISYGFNEHIQKLLDEEKVMRVFPKVIHNLKFETIKKQ